MSNSLLGKLSIIIFNAAIGLCWIIFVIAFMNPFNRLINNIIFILFGVIYILITEIVLLTARNKLNKKAPIENIVLIGYITEVFFFIGLLYNAWNILLVSFGMAVPVILNIMIVAAYILFVLNALSHSIFVSDKTEEHNVSRATVSDLINRLDAVIISVRDKDEDILKELRKLKEKMSYSDKFSRKNSLEHEKMFEKDLIDFENSLVESDKAELLNKIKKLDKIWDVRNVVNKK